MADNVGEHILINSVNAYSVIFMRKGRRLAVPASPSFCSTFREHLHPHGPRLLAEAIIMLLIFVQPAIVLLGIQFLLAWGAHPQALHLAESIDSIVVAILVVLIALNSAAQFVAIALSGWSTWIKDKPSTGSSSSS